MLPVIYGIKEIAKTGPAPHAIGAILAGGIFAAIFLRRQRRLADPLLDLQLFASRAFSVALIVLLGGLTAVGGAMLLVAQYLQLVLGHSPSVAGLWMGLAALAMITGGVAAPMVARWVRPGFVVTAALLLSVIGYLLFAVIGDDPSQGLVLAVFGLALVYLGNGTIAALGTDLVVGSAPPEKAGSASAMTETVQDLGISVGIAVLGSISTAVYRRAMEAQVTETLAPEIAAVAEDSLWAMLSVDTELPDGLIETAQAAFTAGFSVAALVSAVGVTILAILAAIALRRIARFAGE
ncbi:MAG: MFS transporter [Paracoccus sp. (in: a-proteobacteria)]|nr:MFS transporter [Paracoccus sp. (in: a-proteobacteria)]